MKKIVILGGGYGGLLTAKKIARKVKKARMTDSVSITLIDKNPYHTMLTELHEVAAGRVDEESIKIDFDKVFAKRKVDVVLDEIIAVDFDEQILKGQTGKEYPYDYLVIGAGCQPACFGIDGARENALPLWAYEHAVNVKNHILEMFRSAASELDPLEREKKLTFFVAGAGFTGIEMIGELAEWVPILCKKFNIKRSDVKLYVSDMMNKILPNLPQKLIIKAEVRLIKMGVEILTGNPITEVGSDFILIGNTKYNTRTVIWTCGVEGKEFIKDFSIEHNIRKRIATNSLLQSKDKSNVYVVGDNILYIPEGETMPVPQMVENAEHSSATVANNLMVSLTGNGEMEEYKPKFHGMMVCIGGRYGLAYLGSHKKKMAYPRFIAMLAKHMINLIYFIQVAGWNKCYSYMMHEFFHVDNNRSFVGGYFGKRSPNFWTLPLRMFVGIKWLLSGIEKIPQIIEDPTKIFLFQLPTDAVSAATEAAEAYGEALKVPEFIANISNWALKVFIAPIAPFFQGSMVVAEIIIGLCFIGGFLTAPAAVVSAIMCVMIYVSGSAAPEILWYFFAAIALIAGSGSTFGMDYYILPWFKKLWKKIPFVKKWYLYND